MDYATTPYAPLYTIWGANLGYEAPKGNWKVSLDLKNLANKAYVTAVTPLYNARGQDTASFWPGDGIDASMGGEVRYRTGGRTFDRTSVTHSKPSAVRAEGLHRVKWKGFSIDLNQSNAMGGVVNSTPNIGE